MDSEEEFPILNRKESEAMQNYFDTESQFITAKNFYAWHENILHRRLAVSIIANLSRSNKPDALIPYLAMNYFDRFISNNDKIFDDVEGDNDTEKVRLMAVCCLTISAKMRIKSFSVVNFLRNKDMMNISHQMIMRLELLILDELHWKMRSVTAFCFLNYYYPYFKQFGGFKRRCINEIIVQAQGEHAFAHYKPSQIAWSAFMAATKIAYPSKFKQIANPTEFHKIENQKELEKCWNQMVDLCIRLNIQIESSESGIPQEEIEQNKGKAAVEDSCEEDETSPVENMQQLTELFDDALVTEVESLIPGRLLWAEELAADETYDFDKDIPYKEILKQRQKQQKKQQQQQQKVGETSDKKEVTEREMEDIIRISLVEQTEQPQVEGGPISEIIEIVPNKHLMNFELKWPTDVIEEGEIQKGQPEQPQPVNLPFNTGSISCNIG